MPGVTAPPLQLFGVPSWQGRPLPPERRIRLLVVLALARDWVPRERLAQLFWPGREAVAARANLRKLLLEARALALPGLEDGPAGLRWLVPSDHATWCDAVAAADWQRAAACVHGPLLAGVEVGNTSPAFEAWLRYERAELRRRWRDGSLAALAEAPTTAEEINTVCAALLAADPLDDEVLAAWLHHARAAGAPGQATTAWHAYVRQLADEHGLAPPARLQRLAEGPVTPPAAPLYGRDAEAAQACQALQEGARWITLHGPGGVGKTRLARHLMDSLASRFRETWFVNLDDVALPAALAGRIAERVLPGVALAAEPVAPLARHWPAGPSLLVLDGCEHLVDAAGLLEELLARVPGLALLATSRECFDAAAERRLPLAGLGAPPADARPDQVLAHGAVRLLADRARSMRPDFEPADHAPALRRICEATGGLPLALELAASWLRAMPCEDIAGTLAAGRALPATGGQSMDAVFERSWSLLTPAERSACARLSVFRGGFTRDAAAQVGGVALPLLGALVDKSMLLVDAHGRFDFHSLLRPQAWARLGDEATAQAVQERHGRWALAHLLAHHGVRDGGHAAKRAALAAERGNVLAAWQGWVERRDAAALGAAAEVLSWFHVVEGRLPEAIHLFHAAAATLGEATPPGAHLRAHQAWLELWMERYAAAQAMAQRALAVLQRAGHTAGTLLALRTLAHGARRQGRHAASSRLLGQALAYQRPLGDAHMRAMLLDARAMALVMLGRYHRAALLVHAAMRLNTIVGNDAQHMYNEFNLSQALGFAGDTAAALGWADAAVQRAEAIGYRFFRPYARCQRAAMRLAVGDLAGADVDIQAALVEAGGIGGEPGLVWAQELDARVALARGDLAAARARLRQAAARALATGNLLMGAALVPPAAQAAALAGAPARAADWLARLLACSTVQAPVRAEALAMGGTPAARPGQLNDLLGRIASDV